MVLAMLNEHHRLICAQKRSAACLFIFKLLPGSIPFETNMNYNSSTMADQSFN